MSENCIEQVASVIAASYRNRSLGVEWGPYPAAEALQAAGLIVPADELARLRALASKVDGCEANDDGFMFADQLLAWLRETP